MHHKILMNMGLVFARVQIKGISEVLLLLLKELFMVTSTFSFGDLRTRDTEGKLLWILVKHSLKERALATS